MPPVSSNDLGAVSGGRAHSYSVAFSRELRGLDCADSAWTTVEPLSIDRFHPDSDAHRPTATARIVHDGERIHVLFTVQDCGVRSVVTEYQGPVSEDSCVEIFLRPRRDSGYFNLEFNAGGVMLLGYRDLTGENRGERLPWRYGRQVEVRHTLPRVVDPEVVVPVEWRLACSIPLAIFEPYVGPLRPMADARWTGNLFKTAKTSRRHWASWSPIGERRSFHQPERFGELVFSAPA